MRRHLLEEDIMIYDGISSCDPSSFTLHSINDLF